MKFCKDCQHYRANFVVAEKVLGGYRQVTVDHGCKAMSADPVTGDITTAFCAREARRTDAPGYCGPDARFFEPPSQDSNGN